MVLLAVSVENKLYEAISTVVHGGKYKSPQHFLEVAAWNQLALEESTEQDAALSEEKGRPGGRRVAARPPAERRVRTARQSRATQVEGPKLDVGVWQPMVRRAELRPDAFSPPEPLNDPSVVLWGQTNRILPIAVGVRVLAHLLNERDRVAASDWHEQATRVAIVLRDQLHDWDERASRGHGTRWATAFPEDSSASAHRYVNQFLGMPRGNGLSEGGAAFLGFVTFEDTEDNAHAVLTRSGAEWASLENPIFDRNGDEPTSTFSKKETKFFFDHLRRYRGGEYRLLNEVAAFVAAGLSRTQIDEALAREHPDWEKYVSTMRAGVLGRLSDLGLLERTRRGLEVDYHLTPLASELGLPDDQPGVRP